MGRDGRVLRYAIDIDQVLLDGKQIANVNRVPGAKIALFPDVILTPAQKAAVANAVAERRGGIKPSAIVGRVELPGEVLDDEPEEEEDTEVYEQ
jgi:hypothetical protein